MTRRWILGLGLPLLLTGCVSSEVYTARAVPAVQATEEIPETQLLDVGVRIFDAGLPDDEDELSKMRVVPGVRKAETFFVPHTLRKTMQETGFWGAVRMIPELSNSSDVLIEGTILRSDGERLKVEVIAHDAVGNEFLRETYEDEASKFAYDPDHEFDEDPFQDLYNEISNDLVAALTGKSAEELVRIRTVSQLRFAEDLSPDSFGGTLEQDRKGRYNVLRLPAENDPMLDRVERIRERDYMFIDTLDQHYDAFSRAITGPYHDGRGSAYEETIALRELERSSKIHRAMGAAMVAAGAIASTQSETYAEAAGANAILIAGMGAWRVGGSKKREMMIHADALAEVGTSFVAEVEPSIVEVEGRTETLSGSIDQQFSDWRRLLREIYVVETGLPAEESGD